MIKAHGYRLSLLLGALVLGGLVGCGQDRSITATL